MRQGIPALCERLRGKRIDAIVRDVDRVHQIVGVGDKAAEMNTQLQNGEGLGTGAVYSVPGTASMKYGTHGPTTFCTDVQPQKPSIEM